MIPKYLKQAEGTRRCPGEIWSINNDFSKKSIAHTSRFALSLTQPHFSTFASNHYTIYTLQQLPTFSATLSLYWPILPFNLQISAHLCTILDYTTPHPLPYVWQCSLKLITQVTFTILTIHFTSFLQLSPYCCPYERSLSTTHIFAQLYSLNWGSVL